MAKKEKHKARAIITGYLESISAKVFKDDYYKNAVTKMIKGCQGVYALYKNDSLYYVGLAIEFKRRIKQHLKDKHAGKWNKFSLFIIRKEEHIKELESLIVHVAKPKGNGQSGKFKDAENLLPELNRTVDGLYYEYKAKMFGDGTKTKKKQTARIAKKSIAKNKRPLYGLLKDWQRLYVAYKGKDYKAMVRPNGVIEVFPSRERFDSPSMAGIKIIKKKTINGWKFWKYKNKNGELVYIDELRKKTV
ncbi:MAG TPA: hypothetical protein DDW84_08285 [Phycisphaerales bacterium]|nr:MAG: hypothetical protein A2Y13_07310 [Planctomycetes bacterium GWC2_45_44]HBG78821.1 hypothetical protein [Phycisphaerales bacterium]HBR20299.1 hypothetical protein [Phycisphaerales bacterium]